MEEDLRELLQSIIRKLGIMNDECCCCDQDISVAQGCILHEISRLEQPSMQQVADRLGMDITTFSRQVKTLVEKGLVHKEAHSDDRRINILSLTDAGNEAERRIDEQVRAYIGGIFSQFSAFEQETVIRSLKLLDKATPPCMRPDD